MNLGIRMVVIGRITFMCLLLCLLHSAASASNLHAFSHRMIPQISDVASSPVKLSVLNEYVEIDNGIINLSMTKPGGKIAAIGYKGIDNLLEYRNKKTQRGYWDITWQRPDIGKGSFEPLEGTSFSVIAESKDQVEVSFRQTWNASHGDDMAPLNIDKRYIVLRGVSGFYSYAIFEHMEGWPELNIDEARIAFKLNEDLFHYMAISDDKQRIMPTMRDREAGRQLNYKESVLLTNPENPELKGEVDDKYQYSLENKDNHVQGWISLNEHIGFWVITPSDEFRCGGPLKPDLTSHVGPTCLSAFFSAHYAGRDFGVRLQDGEPWKKVFGPVFMYLNSHSTNSTSALWKDAKNQMSIETSKWPYNFPMSRDFPKANQRGTVTGRLQMYDRNHSREVIPAKLAYIGLAPPGKEGSWQHEAKGYQFWTRTNETGYFTIKGIRAEIYNLYAWVPGILGDYKHGKEIIIKPGTYVQMGNLEYIPLRNGSTVWEIGIPDRSAAEFYIPDPAPGLVNKLFGDKDKFRQYGLWDRYTDLYPTRDLSYTIGVSDYHKDWFFAHVNRKMDEYNYKPTTWKILFELRNVNQNDVYILRLALASANFAHVQVWINDPNGRSYFGTRQIGKDNAIARHGIHGQYWLFSIELHGSKLYKGENTIYLKQVKTSGPFNGVMYDYIRLEGPCAPQH